MNVDIILEQVIKEEFAKIQQDGVRVRLKTRRRGYWIYAGVMLAFLALAFVVPIALIGVLVFLVKFFKNSEIEAAKRLAKKHPDTNIGELIKGDLVR